MHVCRLRFWRDNLVVDGRQMVTLVSVHGMGSLFDVYSLVHVLLVPVRFVDTEWSSTPVSLCRFVCSLNLWLSVS